ncbi:TPA: hypothetical protein NHK80_005232 [Pseudomonas aeruginosa]|nr:hypothetical protein [Pseudomonas aeruginosa]
MMKRFFAAVVLTAMSVPAIAESGPNVFLNGKVFKGDEVVASFATPARLGSIVPVKDQIMQHGVATGLEMRVTPMSIAGDRIIVAVKGSLTKLKGVDTVSTSHSGLPMSVALPKAAQEEFSRSFEVEKGIPVELDFGDCTWIEGVPTDCSHKFVLSASVSN